MNAETRTRAVTVEGKEKTQTYTVQVPSTVQEEQAYVVQFPKGYEKFDVAMDAISATDLAGNAIDATTLAARLQKPTHVLAMEGRLASIDPYYLNVMRTDTIVIFVPQGTIDKPKAAGTEIPSPPVPAVPVPAAPAPKAS